MGRFSRYAAHTTSVLSAGTAGRRPPLLPLASAARSPSYISSRCTSRWSSPAAVRVCTMNFTVDSSSPVRGWRAVRSIAENAPSWMRSARRNISEMCMVSPGRAYVSSSRNFGRWRG
ncbi:hypothetical protein AQJ64_16640 [Streptomyces griseoruber]|uniref:Uncharacterized protein n=1 Tax=Streptomyces griseoruber TaxID=1943 RepID=A0A101T100_9ACTN|nr:hypothetical protein AQJ64_16640 [Streptomyces griseoruber]